MVAFYLKSTKFLIDSMPLIAHFCVTPTFCVHSAAFNVCAYRIQLTYQYVCRWSTRKKWHFYYASIKKLLLKFVYFKKLSLVSLNYLPSTFCEVPCSAAIRTNANLICTKHPTTLEKGLKSCHSLHERVGGKKMGCLMRFLLIDMIACDRP